MAENTQLQAESRSSKGKEMAKRLRGQGLLPAVVYGEKVAPTACSVNRKQLEGILHEHGRNVILSLVVEGGDPQNTIIKEIQHHPLRGEILHVDFQRISLTTKIVVEVPVVAEGVPAGVRTDGGILEHMLHSVEVECLPAEIPDKIEIDVSQMHIGDSIHVSDFQIEGNVEIVTEGDRSVFVVVPPTVVKTVEEEEEEELVGEEDEEMQEPEVIERGKRDEEEEQDEQ